MSGWSRAARNASIVVKSIPMSTASARPQLQIRQALEADASPLCEIFNEAVQDHLETFDSEPRLVDDQRLRIAAADQDPKHPILVAELRNWVAGWAGLEPYDNRIALDDIGEVYIYVRRAFRSYGVGRQLMRAIQVDAGKLGYRKLIGRVLAQNQDGLNLCRATGWREVGRHSAHTRLNDGLHDVMLAEYLIPSSFPPQP
jgi:L-amino acid N-acyltransferase YncA